MKVIFKESIEVDEELVDNYFIKIIPRRYTAALLNVEIREATANSLIEIETVPILSNYLFKVDLRGFLPVTECPYDLTIKDNAGKIIWCGQAEYRNVDTISNS